MPEMEILRAAGLALIAILIALGLAAAILLHRRQKERALAISAVASRLGLLFSNKRPRAWLKELPPFRIFQEGHWRRGFHIAHGQLGTRQICLLDYRYHVEGSMEQSVLLLASPGLELPGFSCKPKSLIDKMKRFLGQPEIAGQNHPEFAKQFALQGTDVGAIRKLLRPDVVAWFTANPRLCVEGLGQWVAIYEHGRLREPHELPDLLDRGLTLVSALEQKAGQE